MSSKEVEDRLLLEILKRTKREEQIKPHLPLNLTLTLLDKNDSDMFKYYFKI
jgi:hypothetical protein